MSDGGTVRQVKVAIPGIVASLGAWGVTGGHVLGDATGRPVLWLTTRTDIERVAMEAQPWLSAQVKVILSRAGVVVPVRIMFDTEEQLARLMEDDPELG